MPGHESAEQTWLAERFEAQRPRLQTVAYRMLGSLSEADDAVQETWIKLSRSDADAVENLGAWLTTVTARVCLDMLRSRASRREDPLSDGSDGAPEPAVSRPHGTDPEHEALMADSVGLALLVVLDRLAPAERIAFVLHDVFAVPFDEIAPIVERTPGAAKKLASRARQRVHGTPTDADGDASAVSHHAPDRRVVDAFLAASRGGDMSALLAVLDPNVVRRADASVGKAGTATVIRGADAVAKEALQGAKGARFAQPALINGRPGVIVAPRGKLMLALGFTVQDERIVEIDVIADRARLQALDLAVSPD